MRKLTTTLMVVLCALSVFAQKNYMDHYLSVSEIYGSKPKTDIMDIINLSGISLNSGDTLVHSHNYGDMYLSDDIDGWVKFRFDGKVRIDSMYSFKFSQWCGGCAGGAGAYFTSRSIKDFKIYTSTSYDDLSAVELSDPRWTELGQFVGSQAVESPANWADTFMLGGVEACWLAVKVESIYGSNVFGINEMMFMGDVLPPAEDVLFDYDDEVTSSVTDNVLHNAGEVWVRQTNAVEIDIVAADSAPAGYDLTDSILVINAGTYDAWHRGIMFEFGDSVTVDADKKYLHIAYYLPEKSKDNDGAIRNWLKGSGNAKWMNKSTEDIIAETNNWVDLVYDLTIGNDSIVGIKLDHFEFMGYPHDTISFLGSIVLSDSPKPRFENAGDPVQVLKITLSSSEGTKLGLGESTTLSAVVKPLNVTDGSYTWSLDNDTTGSSITPAGVLTAAQKEGTVTVVATANDGSGKTATMKILVQLQEINLIDYMDNIIGHMDSATHKAGEIWVRGGGNVVALDIIPTAAAPAGYNLTDSVLKIDAGAYVNWWDGLMFELSDTVTTLAELPYLHIAYYIPENSIDNNGAIYNWLKGNNEAKWFNDKNDYYIGETNNWVDYVVDITTDSIGNGIKLDHLEFFGHPRDTVSYIGSVVLSRSATPRFENAGDTVRVLSIAVTSSASGDSVMQGETAQMAATVKPVNATVKTVSWSVSEADTTGSTISETGLFTAGAKSGKASVIATAMDNSGKTSSRKITVWQVGDAILSVTNGIEFAVMPNPANEYITIQLGESLNNANVSIYSITGQMVLSESLQDNSLTVDVSNLSNGAYIIRIANGEKVGFKKIVIQ